MSINDQFDAIDAACAAEMQQQQVEYRKKIKTTYNNPDNQLLRLQPILHIVIHCLSVLDFIKVRDQISTDTYDAFKQCDPAILSYTNQNSKDSKDSKSSKSNKSSTSSTSSSTSSSSTSSSSTSSSSTHIITIPQRRTPSNIREWSKTKNLEFPWVRNTLLIDSTSIVNICIEMQHCIVHSPRGTFPWRTPMMLQWRLFRMLSQQLHGKYSKRRRSNVAVIIVSIVSIRAFLFYCFLLNHSFPTKPNKITNCFKLLDLYYNFTTTFAPASLF